jgi:hypothetical protein
MEASPFWEFVEELLAFRELAALRAAGRCAERLREGPKRLRAVYDVCVRMFFMGYAAYRLLQGRTVAKLTRAELVHYAHAEPMVFLDVAAEASVLQRFGRSWLRSLRMTIYVRFVHCRELCADCAPVFQADMEDRHFVTELVKIVPEALRIVNCELLSDHAVALAALSVDSRAVRWLGELRRDLFVKALEVVPDVDEFLETVSVYFGPPFEDVPQVGLWLLKRGVRASELHPSLLSV